ncbi:hypothetical protein J2Y48_003151 [Mycoplana sp. BE70]|uniref:hypothetical protein n=1 Tax=Mycoplana sp. BE70 TaxID=2817775 RepID=UPI0028645889|nr:hypothetical protein [Mycoplana sp. BE70]MDR6757854.1 hypothetical protein [Mycoplana sp. BE70]
MLNVCIFANSHVNMLKLAADKAPPDGWRPTFIGAPAAGLRGLRAKGNGQKIVPRGQRLREWFEKTSGGLTEVNLDRFDAIVVYGLGLRSHDALTILAEFQPMDLRFCAGSRLISEPAFGALIDAINDQRAAAHVLNLIKGCGKLIILAPAPLPNENLLLRADYQWIKSKKGQAAARWATGLCRDKWRERASAAGATLLLQPEDTITDGCLTLGEYAVGATRLSGRDYNADPTHLNATFGKRVLDDVGGIVLGQKKSTSSSFGPLHRLLRRSVGNPAC